MALPAETPDYRTITMRELGRNTRQIISEILRDGVAAVVTLHGRPVIALTPISSPAALPQQLSPPQLPDHVLAALRRSDADIVAYDLFGSEEGDDGPATVEDHGALVPGLASVSDQGDAFVVSMDLPAGVSRDHITVRADENMVQVRVMATDDASTVGRDVFLPASVDALRMQVAYEDGTLRVELPRAHSMRSHTVVVGDVAEREERHVPSPPMWSDA